MLKAILPAMLMVTVLLSGSCRNTQSISLDLSEFQWKNRLLFLFAPNRNHPFFENLHQSLATRKADAADRDLVIFEILESGPSSMNSNDIDPQTAQSLRVKFDVPRGKFTAILVGKDGGVKLNRQDQTQLKDIFALIDAMPMRREEMRQKRQTRESNAAESDKPGETD